MRTLLLSLLAASAAAQPPPLARLGAAERRARIDSDLKAVAVYREGLKSVLAFAESRPDLFPRAAFRDARLLREEQRDEVRAAWKAFYEYMVALDSARRAHRDFYRLEGAERDLSFLAGYGAFLAQYRFALDFIERAEKEPALDVMFDEAVPDLGVPRGSYSKLKFRFLNVGLAAEFAALAALYRTVREPGGSRRAIEEDARAVWSAGKGQGSALTAANALAVVKKTAFAAWFPVQAGVSEWMGDTKVLRRGRSLVSPEQIRRLAGILEPGDVLLERREWYLSNVGLPGFWPHAALYIGTPRERARYFDDEAVRAWARAQGRADGDFELLVSSRHPAAYAHSIETDHGAAPRVLEAMSEGVSFTTLEHSADADSVAALKPRLDKVARARAILRAFRYAGRPYDFDFDFQTDAALVCTELVYKAYEPAPGAPGLRLPLVTILGRKATPANELARQFDEQFGTPAQQWDLALFLDGVESERRAVEAGRDEFRASWRRPKWHILTR